MVEINNVRRSSICWRGRRELTTDVRNQKSWLWRHCSRRAILLITLITANLSRETKTQINRRRTLPASFSRWWMPTASSLPERLLSSASGCWWRWCKNRLRSVGAYLWLIVVISVRHRLQQYLGFTAGQWLWPFGACYWQAWLQNSKKRAGTGQRDWCMSRVTAIILALLSGIIVCLSWAVNHYRDNAITYKAQRDKNAKRELKLWTRHYWICRCVSVMLLRSMQNTRRS